MRIRNYFFVAILLILIATVSYLSGFKGVSDVTSSLAILSLMYGSFMGLIKVYEFED